MADELKNVTITVDKGTLRRARLKAAESNMSLSRFVGEMLRQQLAGEDEYERAMRRFFASNITIDTKKHGRPFTREEMYDRDERARLRRR
jgi:hypothetical protein